MPEKMSKRMWGKGMGNDTTIKEVCIMLWPTQGRKNVNIKWKCSLLFLEPIKSVSTQTIKRVWLRPKLGLGLLSEGGG